MDNYSFNDVNKPRKIAIFSDSHGLFEPTLAILEDARKAGIEEIYSLGDNIGTGPNPRQVVELLDLYGVKSLKGNHELYATIGVDVLKKHLDMKGGYEEAKSNSSWTRLQLTEEQLEKIANYPEQLIIEIGGEKILLVHYSRDYNTGEPIKIPEGVGRVFQGHKHFKNDNGSIHIVRGAGIGIDSSIANSTEKKAYYIVLTEKSDGGYSIEEKLIPYDYNSTYYDIINSGLNEADKNKIQRWSGFTR